MPFIHLNQEEPNDWRWFWGENAKVTPNKNTMSCFVSFFGSIVNNPGEDKNLSSLRGGGLQSSSLCLDEINLDEVTKPQKEGIPPQIPKDPITLSDDDWGV